MAALPGRMPPGPAHDWQTAWGSLGAPAPGQSAARRRPGQRRRQTRVAAAARSPYDILGVPRDADLVQIKRAFKQRALKLHPDVNKAVRARRTGPHERPWREPRREAAGRG
jgi:hypothetical protein